MGGDENYRIMNCNRSEIPIQNGFLQTAVTCLTNLLVCILYGVVTVQTIMTSCVTRTVSTHGQWYNDGWMIPLISIGTGLSTVKDLGHLVMTAMFGGSSLDFRTINLPHDSTASIIRICKYGRYYWMASIYKTGRLYHVGFKFVKFRNSACKTP